MSKRWELLIQVRHEIPTLLDELRKDAEEFPSHPLIDPDSSSGGFNAVLDCLQLEWNRDTDILAVDKPPTDAEPLLFPKSVRVDPADPTNLQEKLGAPRLKLNDDDNEDEYMPVDHSFVDTARRLSETLNLSCTTCPPPQAVLIPRRVPLSPLRALGFCAAVQQNDSASRWCSGARGCCSPCTIQKSRPSASSTSPPKSRSGAVEHGEFAGCLFAFSPQHSREMTQRCGMRCTNRAGALCPLWRVPVAASLTVRAGAGGSTRAS